jgi:transposase InsO family protein
MRIAEPLPYPTKSLRKMVDLSKQAQVRLKVLDFARDHPVVVTCRRFGIARSTYYRWRKRFDPYNLKSLEDRSRRPKRVRQRTWSLKLIERVRELREQYPAWGKAKLAVLIKREGFSVSESTVGRILSWLKQRGVLREPIRKVKARAVPRKRVYATRKPKDYQVQEAGDLVQIDTLYVQPEPGQTYKQFTAADVVSKWAFADIRSSATARLAKEFLEELISECPFEVRGVQVDGGSEFYADFEVACQQLGIRLFCLPPRSPKLNGTVERVHRTYKEEFWACYDGEVKLEVMRPALKEWTSKVYNGLRPHQSLGYMSPAQYLESLQTIRCSA